MARPKKTVPEAVPEAAEMEQMDGMDTSDSETPLPAPAPPQAQPSLPEVPPPADQEEDFVYDRVPLLVKKRRKRMVAAKKHFEKVKRSWERKKRTYLESEKYSPWEQPSIVKRVRQRLVDADVELGEAWADWIQCRGHWVRWRSYATIMLNQDRHVMLHGSPDPVLERFFERALRRVIEPCPRPSWKVYFAGLAHNIWDWNARHFGLGISHGLMHSDHLFDPSLDPNETKAARTRRLKAMAEAQQQEHDKDLEEYHEELGPFPAQQSFDAWRQERKGKGAAA